MSGAPPVASPCLGTCGYDRGLGLCRDCGRTGEEIAAWLRATETQRRTILATAARRLAQLAAKPS